MLKNKKILITLGDIGGIGPEIVIKALNSVEIAVEPKDIILVGNREIFYKTALEVGLPILQNLEIIDVPFDLSKYKLGEPTQESGKYSLESLKKCCELAKEGIAKAIVTAPVSKKSINMAGYHYSGQTEILKEFLANGFTYKTKEIRPLRKYQRIRGKIKKVFSGLDKSKKLYGPEMLFIANDLRVMLLTRHLKVCEIAQNLCVDKIVASIITLKHCLENDFNIQNPKIALCALNPHAGEDGLLGREEEYFLFPAIKQLKEKHYINIEGPYPSDTLWAKAAKSFTKGEKQPFDAYIACYHDQGMIPVKMLAMDTAVNMTINLPVIRTSPAHGTAYDIAGQNKADYKSMIESIKLADSISSGKPFKTDNLNVYKYS